MREARGPCFFPNINLAWPPTCPHVCIPAGHPHLGRQWQPGISGLHWPQPPVRAGMVCMAVATVRAAARPLWLSCCCCCCWWLLCSAAGPTFAIETNCSNPLFCSAAARRWTWASCCIAIIFAPSAHTLCSVWQRGDGPGPRVRLPVAPLWCRVHRHACRLHRQRGGPGERIGWRGGHLPASQSVSCGRGTRQACGLPRPGADPLGVAGRCRNEWGQSGVLRDTALRHAAAADAHRPAVPATFVVHSWRSSSTRSRPTPPTGGWC